MQNTDMTMYLLEVQDGMANTILLVPNTKHLI